MVFVLCIITLGKECWARDTRQSPEEQNDRLPRSVEGDVAKFQDKIDNIKKEEKTVLVKKEKKPTYSNGTTSMPKTVEIVENKERDRIDNEKLNELEHPEKIKKPSKIDRVDKPQKKKKSAKKTEEEGSGGLVAAVVVGLLALIGGAAYVFRRKKSKEDKGEEIPGSTEATAPAPGLKNAPSDVELKSEEQEQRRALLSDIRKQ